MVFEYITAFKLLNSEDSVSGNYDRLVYGKPTELLLPQLSRSLSSALSVDKAAPARMFLLTILLKKKVFK